MQHNVEPHCQQVYGPHCAAMYACKSAMQNSLHSIAHYFITDPTNQFQLGGPGYELTYSVSWVLQYLLAVSTPGSTQNASPEELLSTTDAQYISSVLKSSFDAIAAHERILVRRLFSFLTSQEQWDRGVRIVGSEELEQRAPTISFVVTTGKKDEPAMKSRDVVNAIDELGGVSGHPSKPALLMSS